MGENAESKNREFYAEMLRNFIADHPQKVIWVKGGIREREAYLVFDQEIHSQMEEFWVKDIGEGFFRSLHALSFEEIRGLLIKLRFGKRLYIGSLHPDYCITPSNGEHLEEPYFCEFCNAIGSQGSWCAIDHQAKPLPKRETPA